MSTKQQLAEAIAAFPDSMNIEEAVERLYRAFKQKRSMRQEDLGFRPNADGAIDMFRRGEISLLRGAELAGLDFESFRILLRDRGIPWETETESSEEMDRAAEVFFGDRA